jgi:hypothetical protein
VSRQPVARLRAWLIDVLCISGWVTVLAVVGVTLYFTEVLRGLGPNVGNAASFVVLILPVTVVLSWLESGSREATIGKRARRLQVVDATTGSRVSFRRALLRNTVKIALPWQLGHTVAYGLIGAVPGVAPAGWLIAATVFAYILPAVFVGTLFLGDGRTPYDRLSRTIVVRRDDPNAATA